MNKNKNIIIAATLAILGTGLNSAFAEANNLVQMDIKRSSVTDTVDVTFYTTADSGNSVVTRKSSNRYVVLLPNTMSTSASAPNFGGVKDLITDVDVKHVNDGMGGYTKVTFGTTKPLNIKTHMAKTAPLSQEQKDARALVAKNNAMLAKANEVKPTASSVAAKATATPVTKPVSKTPQVQHTATPAKTSNPIAGMKLITFEPTKKISNIIPTKNDTSKKEQVKNTPKQQQSHTQVTPKQKTSENTYVPKAKVDNNGKRVVDLEPRVNHSVASTPISTPVQATPPQVDEVNEKPTPIENNVQNNIEQTAEQTPMEKQDSSSNFPYWILYTAGALTLLCAIYLIYDATRRKAEKNKSRLDSFYDISVKNQAQRRKKEFDEIINNEDYSWQEKYKLYNEKDKGSVPKKHAAAMSYVTDISGLKKAPAPVEKTNTPQTKPTSIHEHVVNEKMKAKMLELEKAYNKPAIEKSAEVPNVHSEDDVIMKNFNEIKLKSFSKPMSLKQSNRALINNEEKQSRNNSFKEGKFVKLKNSVQNIPSKANLGAEDLINTGNKYLYDFDTLQISKEKEDYVVSSLEEYLSILDKEAPNVKPMPVKKVNKPTSVAMKRSGVSNPIASKTPTSSRLNNTQKSENNGLSVTSGYSIDTEKGFFVVNMDGVSAIIGKSKDNISVLKKFNRVIKEPIQVRRDDDNVYIVKLGKYKCLVNVEQDKMRTLIEI